MKPKLPHIYNYLPKESLIQPTKNAHKGLSVPDIIMTYGSILGKLKDMPYIMPYMIRCLKESKESYKSLNLATSKPRNIDHKCLEEMKEFLFDLGVDGIGFTQVDRDYIFDNKGLLYDKAIVLTMAMKPEIIQLAPSPKAVKEIFRTYKDLGVIVNLLANFLRNKGFKAQAGPAIGGDANYVMLAKKAGLGYPGKHGLLISPDLGPSLRIAAVYTDIDNLPYTDNHQYDWIEKFCDSCNQCVKNCPAGAIYKDSIILKDQSKVCIDYKKCAVPFSTDHGCTVCIKSCTFFKGQYTKIKEHYGSI